MRAILLSLSLLLVPIAFVPAASAHDYCGEYVCCDSPEPTGEPGTPEHFVTATVHDADVMSCAATDRAIITAAHTADCVLDRQC